MDIVFIQELRLDAWVGIHPREKALPQGILLDIRIGLPAACADDDLANTIDYAAVVARLREELAERRFNLLESLAEFVAGLILDEFAAAWTRVSVAKPGVMPGVKRAGVEIERQGKTPG